MNRCHSSEEFMVIFDRIRISGLRNIKADNQGALALGTSPQGPSYSLDSLPLCLAGRNEHGYIDFWHVQALIQHATAKEGRDSRATKLIKNPPSVFCVEATLHSLTPCIRINCMKCIRDLLEGIGDAAIFDGVFDFYSRLNPLEEEDSLPSPLLVYEEMAELFSELNLLLALMTNCRTAEQLSKQSPNLWI